MKKRFDRGARVADLIQKALAPILQQEMRQTSGLVTITGVTLSRDLSYAKVFVSVLSDDMSVVQDAIQQLNREAKSFRFSLAKEVKLRVIPELRFAFDESTAHGFHITNLINKATKK